MFAIVVLLPVLLLSLPPAANAGFMDKLRSAAEEVAQKTTSSGALSQTEIVSGLKEALSKAVGQAIGSLGRTDGFLGNSAVKIPVPDSLLTVEKGLRLVGRSELADEFVTSMNRAAEQAVPYAKDVFVTAVQEMTFEDAQKILDGADDAATQYFEGKTRATLREKFLPLVDKATDSVGVTRSYKAMTAQAAPVARMAGLTEADLDGYVTDKGLDGLFHMIAQEEKEIRSNPLARTTDLLKKVFGN
jgi:hypothetical protein